MQQPQREIEAVGQDSLCRRIIKPGFYRLHIPISKLIPNKLKATLCGFIKAEGLQRVSSLADRGLRARKDPAIRERQRTAIDCLDSRDGLGQLCQHELPDVPELVREVAARCERRLEIVRIENQILPQRRVRDAGPAQRVGAELLHHDQRVDPIAQRLRHFAMLRVAHDAVQIDRRERLFAHELVARHQHPRDPEKQNVRAGDQRVAGIKALQIGRLIGPAERGERPEPGREPGVEHVRILLDWSAAFRAQLGVDTIGPLMPAGGAGEHRNPVSPPQLPRDVPIADVVHPVLERRAPAVGHDRELGLRVTRHHRLGERLHPHEPLIGQARLDDGVAAIAATHRVAMRLDLFEQSLLLEELDDCLSSLKPVAALERLRDSRSMLHATSFGHDQRLVFFRPDAIGDIEIVGVMRGRDLQHSRAERLLHGVIRGNGNHDAGQWNRGALPAVALVAPVLGIVDQPDIAEHRFRSRGRDGHNTRAILERILDVVQVAVRFVMLGLFIG